MVSIATLPGSSAPKGAQPVPKTSAERRLQGYKISVEAGAGVKSGISDSAYEVTVVTEGKWWFMIPSGNVT